MSKFDCTTELIPEADISGRGVRLSFYIQGACLIISAAYSRSHWRMVGVAAPYAVTGLVYAACTLALGFKSEPEITLYDAVISTSLSGISLLSVIALTLIYTLKHNVDSVFMMCLVSGQALCLLVSATLVSLAIPNFGLNPECFMEIYHIFLGQIPVRRFRMITLIFYSIFLFAFVAFGCYKFMRWYLRRRNARKPTRDDKDEAPTTSQQKRLTIVLIVFSILYVFAIAYVEVLRSFNRTLIADPEGWNFGQIVAFALCIVPMMDAAQVLKQHWDDSRSWHLTPHTGCKPILTANASTTPSDPDKQPLNGLHRGNNSEGSTREFQPYKSYNDAV